MRIERPAVSPGAESRVMADEGLSDATLGAEVNRTRSANSTKDALSGAAHQSRRIGISTEIRAPPRASFI